MRRIGWWRGSGPTSPCPMSSSRWRPASGARTFSGPVERGSRAWPRRRGSKRTPHGARIYLARRPTPKPGSRHMVGSAARPLRWCKKEGNGRRGCASERGYAPSAPHTAGIMREVSRFGTSSRRRTPKRGIVGDRRLPFQVKSQPIRAIAQKRPSTGRSAAASPAAGSAGDGFDHFVRQRGPGSLGASQSVREYCQVFSRSHQELEAKSRRWDADYRCSAVHCFVNSLAVVVVAVFMIVYDPVPHSRLGVKRLAVLVVNHLG